MRSAVLILLASVSLVVTGSTTASAAHENTVDASCMIVGHINFSPGITETASPQTLTFSGAQIGTDAATSCPLAPEDPATMQGTLQAPSLRCDASDQLYSVGVATGRVKILWPDATTSTATLKWSAGAAIPQPFIFKGTVHKGTYAGDTLKAHADHAFSKGGCRPSERMPILQTTFTASENFRLERLLVFSRT
jgi:hypothetical protein